MMTPPADLRARVLAAASAAPSPTRSRGRHALVLAALASIAVGIAVFELAGGIEHSRGRPAPLTFALAGGWALYATILAWLTLGRGRSTLARRPMLVASLAIATPLACLLWMHLFSGEYIEPFERVGYRCFALTMAIAAVPLGAFLALRRGIEPRRPSALGAAAGATAGAWSGVFVDLWCPLTNAAHASLGHALPLALLMIIGALVGRKTLGLRTI